MSKKGLDALTLAVVVALVMIMVGMVVWVLR
jgi:hypothetical protein